MAKILIINRCDDCHYFDNEYYGYNETCRRLDRTIETADGTGGGDHPIPDDCPLDSQEN